MASDKVLTLTNDNFKGEVLQQSGPVLVDFWAPWCSPCRMISPIIDELAGEYSGKAKVGKVNVDENREIAVEYGVMSIPTLILFKDGNAVDRVVGFKSKKDLQNLLDQHI
ncbi:thioredoxin [Phosphitispora sp. TUW77]|uniref:thioredoxin n=1 Tax=Phosphitispora sp. TUW77 TaxID=3152361 RepID=UPI003AB7716D